MVDHEGVSEVDEEKLHDRLPTIADNFRCSTSTHAFAAFIAFECCLTLAPLFLLLVVLPLMIGSGYRTYGIDVAKAWWEHREWYESQGSKRGPLAPFYSLFLVEITCLFRKGVPLKPAIGSSTAPGQLPLIPRITYCDYHFVTMGNSHMLTYRCYLDANWHERTALFTW